MDDYSKRIDQAYTKISGIKNKVAKRDLLMIMRSTEAAYTKLDMESVECRRLHKTTSKYQELEKNLVEVLDHLEKHITFASLLN